MRVLVSEKIADGGVVAQVDVRSGAPRLRQHREPHLGPTPGAIEGIAKRLLDEGGDGDALTGGRHLHLSIDVVGDDEGIMVGRLRAGFAGTGVQASTGGPDIITPTTTQGPFSDVPTKPIVIKSARLVTP